MAPNYQLLRARGGEARRDQKIDIVISRFKFSENYYTGVRSRLPRLYDLWRGVYTGRFHPHKNNVHVPIIFQMVWSDAARKVATSLNSWPLVYFLGYGPDDAAIARKREALISAQMKDAEVFEKEVTTFVTADLYGTAISAVMWDFREEQRMVETVDTLPLSGTRIRQIQKKKVVTFDGPNYEGVDRLDAFPQPGVGRMSKMKWFIRRYYLDIDECRFMAEQGTFDKDELNRLIHEGGVNAEVAADDVLMRRFQVRTGMTDAEARWMDKYTRPIEMLEMWGTVPSELADNGVTNRVMTIANRRYLFRDRGNPFWHGRLPFLSFSPTPDPHYFDGIGKADIAEKLQIAANRYVNQSLDGADLVLDPMWFYDRNKGLNTRNFFTRPGKMMPVDGDPRAAVHPLVPNLGGFQVGAQQVSQMREFAQMGTGIIEDAVSGLPGPDRQTAREFVGRREAAGTRLMLESRIYEECYFEPLANTFVALDKQFLSMPKEILVLGDAALYDPVSGRPFDATRETIYDEEMAPNYAARAIGATTALSRSVRQQNLFQVLQIIASAPNMMGNINMLNFLRAVMRELEIPNVNELIQESPAAQPMLQQLGVGAEQVPTSGQMVEGTGPPVPLQAQGAGLPSDLAGTLAPA